MGACIDQSGSYGGAGDYRFESTWSFLMGGQARRAGMHKSGQDGARLPPAVLRALVGMRGREQFAGLWLFLHAVTMKAAA